MNKANSVELILKNLGITEPYEIDLEAIAWTFGIRIRYRPLEGCEALIAGYGDQGIIIVNDNSSPRRQRFSIAHELGHWEYHRGRWLECQADEARQMGDRQSLAEREADKYAADMLMPHYLFKPIIRNNNNLTFDLIKRLADLFNTSITSTAIRIIEGGYFPAILICHGLQGRKWFFRSPDVPRRWFPKQELDPDSYAFDILFGNTANNSGLHKIDAEAWFDRAEASKYEVKEQTFKISNNEVLVIILIEDEIMLSDSGMNNNFSYRNY